MRLLPSTLREWVIAVFGAVGIGLLPWTVWLSISLKPHHVTENWDLAWSGFDSGMALLFVATAIAAYRRSPWVGALAAALGTMLLVDAWFDAVLESHWDERLNAILLAVFAELPAALFCFWIATRTERFLARVIEGRLELTPPGERAAESDLVGVLEVSSDGEAAREACHPDTSA